MGDAPHSRKRGAAKRRRSSPDLRSKIIVYLVLLHLVLGAVAFLVLSQQRWMLLGAEALFAVSIAVGILLVRSFFVPLRMIRAGAELIREGDFTARFREVGQPEMDELIRIYNRMIDRLREERLRAREQQILLDRVLQASPAGIVTLDFDDRVTYMNPSAERLLAVSAADLAGRRFGDSGIPVVPELASLGVGASCILTLRGLRVKFSCAEFYDRGFVRRFFVMEELTEELRAWEKATYEKIIRILSHEVNNSVGAVSSLLDSVGNYSGQLREADRADFRQALAVAIARMDHLDAFMRGFADVVRLPAPDLRPCDLKTLVDEVLVLLRPEMERRGIRCRWEKAEALPPAVLDKNQIEQVLVNVLKNAAEAIGEDGTITLSLWKERGAPGLAIADSGGGIPPDIRANLFSPFFSTKRDGRGLGLTLVREILVQHRFEFALEDRPEGGAIFRIRFES